MKVGNLNWENFPKSLINQIYCNLTIVDILELRLINKHWSHTANSKLFSSIKIYKNQEKIIEKYSNWILKANNGHLGKDLTILVANSCNNLKYLDWKLPSDLDALIIILKKCQNIRYIKLRHFNRSEVLDYVKLDKVLELILQLKDLDNMNLEIYGYILFDFFLKLSLHNLTKLTLCFQPSRKTDVVSNLNSMINIRIINLCIVYSKHPTEQHNRDCIPSPSNFLIHKNIEHLFLNVKNYKSSSGTMQSYVSQGLVNLFKNHYFVNLKSVAWHFNYKLLESSSIFTTELPPIANKFTKLKFIYIVTMDKFLFSFIIDHCPNLQEIGFKAPFILPHNASNLYPLRKLRSIYFEGFEDGIEANYRIILLLLPNVKFVKGKSRNLPIEDILKSSPIQLLFPKAKFLFANNCNHYQNNCIYCC